MNRVGLIAIVVLCACGDPSPVTTGGPDGGSPAEATALQAGTYQAPASATARALTAVGPAMSTTLIADWGGSFSMVLPNYDFVRGAMRVNPDGTLAIGTGNVIAHQDGGVEPAVIAGTAVGSTISATVNGQPFSVALTDIAAQDFAVSKMVGRYVSTSSSTGNWISIEIATSDPLSPEHGTIYGYAFASQVDAQAGNPAKALGHYLGSITHTDVPASCPKPCTPTPNSFQIGFCYVDDTPGVPIEIARHPCTFGFAYFTTSGLVALTVQPATGEQITATFSR